MISDWATRAAPRVQSRCTNGRRTPVARDRETDSQIVGPWPSPSANRRGHQRTDQAADRRDRGDQRRSRPAPAADRGRAARGRPRRTWSEEVRAAGAHRDRAQQPVARTRTAEPSAISRRRCRLGAAFGLRRAALDRHDPGGRPQEAHGVEQHRVGRSQSLDQHAAERRDRRSATTDSLAWSWRCPRPGRPGRQLRQIGLVGDIEEDGAHARDQRPRRTAGRSSARRPVGKRDASRCAAARSRSLTISTARNRIRSTQAPAGSPTRGSQESSAVSRPTSKVRGVQRPGSRPAAARVADRVPNWLTVSPIHSRRKSRWCHSPPRRVRTGSGVPSAFITRRVLRRVIGTCQSLLEDE